MLSEEQKGKRVVRNEQKLVTCGTLSGIPQYSNGIPGRRGEKGTERDFREMMAQNAPNLMKNISLHFQEAQTTLK